MDRRCFEISLLLDVAFECLITSETLSCILLIDAATFREVSCRASLQLRWLSIILFKESLIVSNFDEIVVRISFISPSLAVWSSSVRVVLLVAILALSVVIKMSWFGYQHK